MGLNVLSFIHGMSSIWDVRYWEVLLYFSRSDYKEQVFKQKFEEYLFIAVLQQEVSGKSFEFENELQAKGQKIKIVIWYYQTLYCLGKASGVSSSSCHHLTLL